MKPAAAASLKSPLYGSRRPSHRTVRQLNAMKRQILHLNSRQLFQLACHI